MQMLLKLYDGYHFSDVGTHVCNSVSLAFFSQGCRFSNY